MAKFETCCRGARKGDDAGSEAIVTLNAKNQLTFLFEKALVHVNGPSARSVSARYDYYWGRGYK